jgi:hypothetical protein
MTFTVQESPNWTAWLEVVLKGRRKEHRLLEVQQLLRRGQGLQR